MRARTLRSLFVVHFVALPVLVLASCPPGIDDPCTTAWSSGEWASYHALLWITRIALFAVAVVSIWRLLVVARDKIATKPLRSCVCFDGQLRILSLNASAALIWAILSLDPLGLEQILSRFTFYGGSLFGTLLNLLGTGLMVRFFALIVSKFHARTKKVVIVLDVLCVLLLTNEIVAIAVAYFGPLVVGFGLYFGGIALFTGILVIGASIYAPVVLTSKLAHVRVTDEERRARQQLLRIIRAMQCAGACMCVAVLWVAFQTDALKGEPMQQALGWFAIVDTVECGVGLGTVLVMGRTAKSSASVAPQQQHANVHINVHSPVGSTAGHGAEPVSPGSGSGSSTATRSRPFANFATVKSPRSDQNTQSGQERELDKSDVFSRSPQPIATAIQISDVKTSAA